MVHAPCWWTVVAKTLSPTLAGVQVCLQNETCSHPWDCVWPGQICKASKTSRVHSCNNKVYLGYLRVHHCWCPGCAKCTSGETWCQGERGIQGLRQTWLGRVDLLRWGEAGLSSECQHSTGSCRSPSAIPAPLGHASTCPETYFFSCPLQCSGFLSNCTFPSAWNVLILALFVVVFFSSVMSQLKYHLLRYLA